MKRFIIYILTVFFVIAGLAFVNDMICVWLIRHSGSSNAVKMERLWTNPEPDEIPIFGSSRALGNFVPSMISSKCFDYGCNGMAKEEIIFLLEVFAKRNNQVPVIINFDPWQSNVGQPFVGDYRLVPNSGRLSITEKICGIRFHGKLKHAIVDYYNSRNAVTKVIDRGAEILKYSRSAEEWKVINAKQSVWGFTLKTEIDKPFERAIRDLSPRKVYIVIGPCCSTFTEKYPSLNSLSDYLKHLKTICPNVDVINFFGDPSFTDNDFCDALHLNINGAQKFSKKLKNILYGE